MITYIKGNILNEIDNHDVVIHGCNCFHTMGSGIAKVLSDAYPQVLEADMAYSTRGNKDKLGDWSATVLNNGTYIINAYTQYRYGRDKVHLDYQAMIDCFDSILQEFGGMNYSFIMPKIGCGLAGGDWNVVKKIIEEMFHEEHVTIIEL